MRVVRTCAAPATAVRVLPRARRGRSSCGQRDRTDDDLWNSRSVTIGQTAAADGRTGGVGTGRVTETIDRSLAVCRNKRSTDSTRRDATRVTDRTPRCIGHGRCPLRGGNARPSRPRRRCGRRGILRRPLSPPCRRHRRPAAAAAAAAESDI
jgi:hypothetical protein